MRCRGEYFSLQECGSIERDESRNKNLNSFRSVERAADYEIARQSESVAGGEKGDGKRADGTMRADRQMSQRVKSRRMIIGTFQAGYSRAGLFSEAYVDQLRRSLPELPMQRNAIRGRIWITESGCGFACSESDIADYFEQWRANSWKGVRRNESDRRNS